jgi:glyoxalase family protein
VGTVLTSFPYGRRGIRGRRGTGQVKTFDLSVPRASLEYWADRFSRLAVPHGAIVQRFDQRTMSLAHPAGLEFVLVEDDRDRRTPWEAGDIPREVAIRGLRSVTLSLRETADTEIFMRELGFREAGREGARARYEIGQGGPAATVEILHEPDVAPGTWTYAAGTVHHVAFAVEGEKEQLEIKAGLEALGYVDVSEIKNRNYFRSIYVRTPGGVLFEFATKAPGFAIDEPADQLGQRLLFPEWYDDRRGELVADLEPIQPPAPVA